MRAGAVLAAMCLCACAGAPASPFFGDEKYLRFGVEPDAEASALVKEREKLGESLATRITGQSFTALGFIDRNGQPVAVRVVTARGIELALDLDDRNALTAPTTYELVAAPLTTTQDADGDGFEEVFVMQRQGTARCMLVYRVRDVGFVDEVPVTVHAFGQDLCPTSAEDLNADGKVELLASAALDGVAFPKQASVRVPLWASEHRFALGGPADALASWMSAERTSREIELAEARRLLDVRWALRLAFELAALSLVDGQTRAQQLQVFDAALHGLVLDADEQTAVLAARARIDQKWNPATVAPGLPGAPGSPPAQ